MKLILSLVVNLFIALPLTSQASLFDFFSNDKEYIETTKKIVIPDMDTTEEVVRSMLETLYFVDNNPELRSLTALYATAITNKTKVDPNLAIISMQLGNYEPLKQLLNECNPDYISLDYSDIDWRVDGKLSDGRVIIVSYKDYSVSLETVDDSDYITLSVDDIIGHYSGKTMSYTKMLTDPTEGGAMFFTLLLNNRE